MQRRRFYRKLRTCFSRGCVTKLFALVSAASARKQSSWRLSAHFCRFLHAVCVTSIRRDRLISDQLALENYVHLLLHFLLRKRYLPICASDIFYSFCTMSVFVVFVASDIPVFVASLPVLVVLIFRHCLLFCLLGQKGRKAIAGRFPFRLVAWPRRPPL